MYIRAVNGYTKSLLRAGGYCNTSGFRRTAQKANNLARGALVAAASEQCNIVSAEHVRIASTEII